MSPSTPTRSPKRENVKSLNELIVWGDTLKATVEKFYYKEMIQVGA